jgi:hypothetical protein
VLFIFFLCLSVYFFTGMDDKDEDDGAKAKGKAPKKKSKAKAKNDDQNTPVGGKGKGVGGDASKQFGQSPAAQRRLNPDGTGLKFSKVLYILSFLVNILGQ